MENRLDNKVKRLYKKKPAKGDNRGGPSNVLGLISNTLRIRPIPATPSLGRRESFLLLLSIRAI